MSKIHLVVTSISSPNAIMRSLADGAARRGIEFIVIGDEKSPQLYELPGSRFLSLAEQRSLPFRFASACPTRSYSRKNIGYLIAWSEGADIIIETDDDNAPYDSFWNERHRSVTARGYAEVGWVNVYRYFCDHSIWPRGLPLDEIRHKPRSLSFDLFDSPIQQALANGDPDVDAIFRLVSAGSYDFDELPAVALAANAWCPFNSQNTSWWRDAAGLMYLPTYCSFRMTDIWRGFVAQRIAWENEWQITFHAPTVFQDRNPHDYMKDFAEEIPGYLNNKTIANTLSRLPLAKGVNKITDNLRACYEALIKIEVIGAKEMELLNYWIEDLANIQRKSS